MRYLGTHQRRSGATLVEFAVVGSAVLLLICGLIVLGTGVFRYQEMAHLAREGARYAATHGSDYAQEGMPKLTGVPAVVSKKELEDYLHKKAFALDKSKLTIDITWSAPSTYTPRNVPKYLDTDTSLNPPGQKEVQNYVTVTVTYQWLPEAYLAAPMKLTSISTMAMSY